MDIVSTVVDFVVANKWWFIAIIPVGLAIIVVKSVG